MITEIFSRLGESNPQLFRELKGKAKPKNLIIASLISVIGQGLIYLYYVGMLPASNAYNRYCVGKKPYSSSEYYDYCVKDLQGNWMIIKELWWLDIFIALSTIAIFGLLIIGTYMLIADISKEERQGSLNFIRLSPQSALNILIGKILGVPILLYVIAILGLPFQLWAGLSASIPLPLILAFNAVLVAGCAFFFSAAILFALVSTGFAGFQAWIGAGVAWFMLSVTSTLSLDSYMFQQNPIKWLTLFYPGAIFPYLVESTFLPHNTVGYFKPETITNLSFYGLPIFAEAAIGIAFVLFNFALWSYWIWQGIGRRFHNPLKTVLTKPQSYIVCATYIIQIVGFTQFSGKNSDVPGNFVVLQLFIITLFVILMGALSPQRQTLIDWAAYRHQAPKNQRGLLKSLLMNDKSPSIGAIAINLLFTTGYIIPFIVFSRSEYRIAFVFNQLISVGLILIYAILTQMLLFNIKKKVGIAASFFVGALAIFTIIPLSALFPPHSHPTAWLFTPFSWIGVQSSTLTSILMSMFAQWGTFALLTLRLNKQLKKAGESQTLALLNSKN